MGPMNYGQHMELNKCLRLKSNTPSRSAAAFWSVLAVARTFCITVQSRSITDRLKTPKRRHDGWRSGRAKARYPTRLHSPDAGHTALDTGGKTERGRFRARGNRAQRYLPDNGRCSRGRLVRARHIVRCLASDLTVGPVFREHRGVKRLCGARLRCKPGLRCRKPATAGKLRCRLHGGAARHGRHLSEDEHHSISFSKARAARGPLYPLDPELGGRIRARQAPRGPDGRFLPGRLYPQHPDAHVRKALRIVEKLMTKDARLQVVPADSVEMMTSLPSRAEARWKRTPQCRSHRPRRESRAPRRHRRARTRPRSCSRHSWGPCSTHPLRSTRAIKLLRCGRWSPAS